jgi:hypothetical protein
MDKLEPTRHLRHDAPFQQQPTPNSVGASATGMSLPLQPHLLSQGLQEVLNNLGRIQKQRELQAMQNQQQMQPTTLFSPTTGRPFAVTPTISNSATLSAENSQRALGVFAPSIFEDHDRRLSNMNPPMRNREIPESGFSYSPSLEFASPSGSARLEAPALQSPDELKNKASSTSELNSASASNATTFKRGRDAGVKGNSGSALWHRDGGSETSTGSPTTTTTTDGLGSLADATDQGFEPASKKRRIETPASSNTREPFASLSSELDKMQSIIKRYKSATEIAQKRLGHDFLEDEDIHSYGDEFKKECICLVRLCLRHNFLGVCEKIISECEKFYADTFPPAFSAGERARWRVADELAPRDLDNLCALLNRSNLIKLLGQRDEFRQQAPEKSTLPHEVLQLAPVMLPTVRSEVSGAPLAPERRISSEPAAASDVASQMMAIIMESPANADSFVKNFLDLVDIPPRITQATIDDFISDKRNFQTVETTGEFLRAIFSLLSAIGTQHGLSEKFDRQSILQSALKKLFGQMQDKQAGKEKIAITNRILFELAIDNARICNLIGGALTQIKPAHYYGIVYKADFDIISGLHETGVPNFRPGSEILTNPVVNSLRDGDKLSKKQVVSHFTTAQAGSSVKALNDYFRTLEFLLDGLLSGREKIKDLTAKDLIALALDRLEKTSSAGMLTDNVSSHLLRLAIKSERTCDILVRMFRDMSEEKKRKFRVVRKLEFFIRAHALLKAKFYVPAPSRQSTGGRASTLTGSQEADQSTRNKSTARTVDGPAVLADGRTESTASTVKRPMPRTTANSSATTSNVLAGQAAASADRQDIGEKSLFTLDDESEG